MSGHTYTHTHIHTHTTTIYYNPRCAHAHRGLIICICNIYIYNYNIYCIARNFRGLKFRGFRGSASNRENFALKIFVNCVMSSKRL